MKRWLDTTLNRQRLAWGVGMGLGAMVVILLVMAWLNSLSVVPGDLLLVRPAVLAALGWPVPALLALELALAFGFGVSVGLAVPPMEGTGAAVAVRTAIHLAVSSALFAGICWVCGLPPGNWQGLILLLGLYWLMYLTALPPLALRAGGHPPGAGACPAGPGRRAAPDTDPGALFSGERGYGVSGAAAAAPGGGDQ